MTPQPARGRAYLIDSPAAVTLEPRDRFAVALDRLLGVKTDTIGRLCEAAVFSDRVQARLASAQQRHLRVHRDLPGLRAASFEEVLEAIRADYASSSWPERAREAQTSTDFATLLGNTLHRRLLAAYAEAEYGERSLMRPGVARDLRDQRLVGVDGAPDVPAVDLEVGGDYTELGTLAERAVTHSMLQKGLILTITRRVIINNDVAVVQRVIDELGRAARRTLARAVWGLWIDNATYGPDSTAWFHANHNNLQSTAISEAEVIAAVRKLLDQTQPGNAEKMGTRARPGSLWLTVPTALWDAAYKLNQTQASALYHLFGFENEYIIVNPLLVDANDFGVHRDASEVESIRTNFLNGREEPEFLVADLPSADQLFTADKLRYKLRHEWGVALAEFRGAVKAEVA
jgi:hypothetical protein